MPNNFIQVNLSARNGAALYAAVALWVQAKDNLAIIAGILPQMTDGVDFTTIEAVFGLPTGKGQAVNAMILNANTEINGSANMNALAQALAITR